ncbi:hypothetical protein J7K55_07950 [Candidatus Aerophobetes bacterium]|nr:hypothetical protein [Candidatus Aerophobetes bacterium]
MENIYVECYSGYKYADRPEAFVWKGKRYRIKNILKRWREEQGEFFIVEVEEGEKYTISYNEKEDRWSLLNKEN